MRDIRDVEKFIAEHPAQAHLWAFGLSILILEVAMLIDQGLIYLARHMQ